MKVRTPRTTAAATELLEQHAALMGELATIEAQRASALAATNAVADTLAVPVLEKLSALLFALELWWSAAKADLTGGKRKSIELGGCLIGTRTGGASLATPEDVEATVADMKTLRWTKPYLSTKITLDKSAIRVALGGKDSPGKHAPGLALLGFSIKPGAETFYVERIAAGAVETTAR